MYLLVAFGMCVAYFILYYLFPYFFTSKIRPIHQTSLYSIGYILIVYAVVYFVSISIEDIEFANRILHTFGGGFLSFMICFFVVKDTRLSLSRFQFFIFSFLVAVGLGVVNEIIEFFLQNYLHMVMATSISDTWFDLISNCVGVLIAVPCFVPFIKKFQ